METIVTMYQTHCKYKICVSYEQDFFLHIELSIEFILILSFSIHKITIHSYNYMKK